MGQKKVLVVHFGSKSGQLSNIIRNVTAPLAESEAIEYHHVVLKPRQPYPFPWPILKFFDAFPESIYLDPPAIEPVDLEPGERFDLVVLGYQVWFLSPSGPTVAFLKSSIGKDVLKNTPVVTVIGCRDMWLLAQEQTKALLAECGASLIGNIAMVDEAGSVRSFFATPLWMLTGKRGPLLRGLIPRAGVHPDKMRASRRFGARMRETLEADAKLDENLLRGLGAVKINTRLLVTERAARRGFLAWGALLRKLGPPGALVRKPVVALYTVFLVCLLMTVLPVSALVKTLLRPLLRHRIAAQVAYFSQPSGETETT